MAAKTRDAAATRTVRVQRGGVLMDVETPVVESRLVPNYREPSTDDPGLVLTDDGTVWLVNPDGTRTQLPGGGGSFPTFYQTAAPSSPADGDTWMRPAGTGGTYPNTYGVGAFRWSELDGFWAPIAPVRLRDDGTVAGFVTIGPDGNIVAQRSNDAGTSYLSELFLGNATVGLFANDGTHLSSFALNPSGSTLAVGQGAFQLSAATFLVEQDPDAQLAVMQLVQGAAAHTDGDSILSAANGLTHQVFAIHHNGRVSISPDTTNDDALVVELAGGGQLLYGDDRTGFALTLTDGQIFTVDGNDNGVLKASRAGLEDRLGFFGVTPIARPTVASADAPSILAALVALGLVIDGT